MKIAILLPYKENFSPEYPGAVSLFINDTSLLSRYKKNIKVYGSSNYKKLFKINYVNISLSKHIIESQSKKYINDFITHEKNERSNLIEIHNRPNYLRFLIEKLNKRNYSLFFHNDPCQWKVQKISMRENIF